MVKKHFKKFRNIIDRTVKFSIASFKKNFSLIIENVKDTKKVLVFLVIINFIAGSYQRARIETQTKNYKILNNN
jgi:hypothetical protein